MLDKLSLRPRAVDTHAEKQELKAPCKVGFEVAWLKLCHKKWCFY